MDLILTTDKLVTVMCITAKQVFKKDTLLCLSGQE